MSKIRILVVDDHGIMRDSMRALLDLHDDIEIVGEASSCPKEHVVPLY